MVSIRKWLYGSASNLLRLVMSVVSASLLPPLLIRRLSQAQYSAWVLILQLAAYVALLDGGLQTVTAKLVAEHHARDESHSAQRMLSSAVSLLSYAALLGIVVVALLTWRVPQIFHQMPPVLISQVRISLLLIGCSAAFALPFNPFAAVFTGLQEYGFLTANALITKLLSLALLASMAVAGRSMVQLAAVLAVTNVLTAIANWMGWRRYARARIAWTLLLFDRNIMATLLRSGGILSLWTLGGLLVSGLDLMIVGHYDFPNTGFYSIAATATNLMLLSVSSVFAPMLPAISAIQATNSPRAVGDLTMRASRLCSILLCLIAVPLAVLTLPLLSIWVGTTYATHSAPFLKLLVIGNLIRLFGLPYSTAVIATSRQHLATIATLAEALVNAGVSLWLVQRIGAVGVAYGTIVGGIISISLHLAVSMRATRKFIDFSPARFAFEVLLRPMFCLLPVALLLTLRHTSGTANSPIFLVVFCFAAVLLLLTFVGLTQADRAYLMERVRRLRRTALPAI